MKRRDFIKYTALAGTALSVGTLTPPALVQSATPPEAVWVSGGEPEELLHAALSAFGGMKHFISRGDVVVVKPNIGWDRAPEFAANTNPQLVAAVVKACYDAGAATVKVFDRTCNNPRRCYLNSKIETYARKVGARVEAIREHKFVKLPLKDGLELKEWPIYREYLEADKVINIPIAKHHSLARVTLGLKNLMGVMGGNRGDIHNHFSRKLIDIDSHILPTLTIVDAYRILLRNGPRGGNLGDVALRKTLIMSPCTVTADRLALELFQLQFNDVPHVQEAYRRGLNRYDFRTLNLKRISLD